MVDKIKKERPIPGKSVIRHPILARVLIILLLFLFVGVFQLFTGYSLLKRPDWKGPNALNPVKKYYWAWTASWAAGVIMFIWIIVEIALLGYISPLQPIIFVWGLVLIILTVLPPVKRYYRIDT